DVPEGPDRSERGDGPGPREGGRGAGRGGGPQAGDAPPQRGGRRRRRGRGPRRPALEGAGRQARRAPQGDSGPAPGAGAEKAVTAPPAVGRSATPPYGRTGDLALAFLPGPA